MVGFMARRGSDAGEAMSDQTQAMFSVPEFLRREAVNGQHAPWKQEQFRRCAEFVDEQIGFRQLNRLNPIVHGTASPSGETPSEPHEDTKRLDFLRVLAAVTFGAEKDSDQCHMELLPVTAGFARIIHEGGDWQSFSGKGIREAIDAARASRPAPTSEPQ